MEYLRKLINDHNIIGTLAEIGTDSGDGSTRIFLDHVNKKGGEFYAIDKFPDDKKYRKVKTILNMPNTHAVQGYSVDIAKNWDKKLDFLFIDGDHNFPHISPTGHQTGTVLDILAWHPHIKKNGILAFHDYYGSKTDYGRVDLLGVEYAIDSFCNQPSYKYIGQEGSIIAFEKLKDDILFPQLKKKKVPDEYIHVWQRLNDIANEISTIIIYGTAASAKYVYDAISMRWDQKPKIIFTDSFTKEESILYGENQVIPFDKLKNYKAIFVIGSLFEKEITEILHKNEKHHLKNYFKLFEFVGWCYLGRFFA